GIGIPPKLFTYYKDKSGTEYTINMIPLGGFVRLKGEDPKDEGTFTAPDSFIMAKFRNKVLILCGGVIMNFLAAYVLFSGGFWLGSKPISVLPSNAVVDQLDTKYITTFDQLIKNGHISGNVSEQPVVIGNILPDGLASKAGLSSGDRIISLSGQTTNSLIINRQLKSLIGQTFEVGYQHSGSATTQTVSITCPDSQCLLGIVMDTKSNVEIKPYKYPLGQSLVMGRHELVGQSKLSLHTLGRLFGSLLSFDKEKIKTQTQGLTGPAGAVKIGELIYQAGGWIQFLIFGAMISLSLAVFNILPIPALDGGRLLGVIIQTLFGLKPQKYFTIEGYINIIFFVLLMGLGVLILIRDLSTIRGLF
ncbi:MAG TPA: site-2 protease family protein, partial [Candidatus Absconditabacterales bacterium]|nr:site-2 protease family protein [Candidatus Absconditabacterales bacterium]